MISKPDQFELDSVPRYGVYSSFEFLSDNPFYSKRFAHSAGPVMTGNLFLDLIALPIGFGLFGFIEPCSIASTLTLVKVMEGNSATVKLAQVLLFALVRGVLIGVLGVAAVFLGAAFFGFQKAAWIVLGSIYAGLGLAYLTGKVSWLKHSLGPRFARLSTTRAGAAVFGLVLGLNIPACATPLLLALLGASAASGTQGGSAIRGFISLGLFGFALSLPLVASVLFAPARRVLDWLAALSRRVPVWTGLLLILLGVWSIWFGLFANV